MCQERLMAGINIGAILRNAALAFPRKEALVDAARDKRYSYRELHDRVNKLANALLAMGIEKGDFVAVLCTNRTEFVELYFACAKTGGIIAPLNYRLSAGEIVNLVNFIEAKVFVYAEEFKGLVQTAGEELGARRRILIGEGATDGDELYEEILANQSVNEPDVEIDEHDPMMVLFTSGTTGLPKGILQSQYVICLNALMEYSFSNYTQNDNILIVLPLYAGAGFLHVFAAVYGRAKMVVRDFEPAGVMQTIERESISFSSWVATMAWVVLQSPALDQYSRDSLRGVSFIGAPLPIPVLEGVWQRITPNVYEYYGLQDAGFVASITPEVKREKPGSCGAAAPLTDIMIVDHDGKEVPRGEVGEVLIRTVSSPGGYYKEKEKTKETFKNGWMHSKDLGKFDEDGYLYLVGRKSEMIISGGQNIFATEIEEVLLAQPGVADVAVVGLPDEKWGEAVTAVIVLKPDTGISEEDVLGYSRKTLADYKVPKRVIFTDDIPRTPTGKVRKFILIERYSVTMRQPGL